jgi:hypothetical protein
MITLHLFNILKASCFYHSSFYKSTFYFYPLSICPYLKSHLFRHYFWNLGLPRFSLSSFSSAEWFGTEFPEFSSIFGARNGTEFRVVFSSDEQFGRECSYFCCTERNSELFFILLMGSEGNSDRLLLFLFNGTEFRVVFSSAERVRNGIPRVSVPRNSRNSAGNNHLFRLFRFPRNNFFVGNSQPYSCTRMLLVSQDWRHIFVTPWKNWMMNFIGDSRLVLAGT